MALLHVISNFVFMGKYIFRSEEIEDYLNKNDIQIDNFREQLEKLVYDQFLSKKEKHNKCVLFKGREYELRYGKRGFGYYLIPHHYKNRRGKGNRISILKKKTVDVQASKYWRDNEYRISSKFITEKMRFTI